MFSESFIPVTLVLLFLVVVLLYAQFKISVETDQMVVIEIVDAGGNGDLDNPGQENEEILGLSIENGSASENPLVRAAEEAMLKGDWARAEKAYRQVLANEPTSNAHNNLGELFLKQNQLKKSLQLFDKALTVRPVDVTAYLNKGIVFSRQNKNTRALAAYDKLLVLVPFHFEGNFNKGLVLLKKKDNAGAIQSFNKATTLAGGVRKARALYLLATSYFKQNPDKNRQAGMKALTKAIRIKPDYLKARILLAAFEPDTPEGRKRALEQYRKIEALKPNYAPTHFQIALTLSRQKDTEGAKGHYHKAIRFNPDYEAARYNLGTLYLSVKKWAKAREQFEWLSIRNSKDSRLYFNLGRVASGEKNFAEALDSYQKAIDLRNGVYPEAYLNLGLLHRRQRKYPKAIQAYKKALTQKTPYPEAHLNLGLVYLRQKKAREAFKELNLAVEQKPTYARAWYNLGIIHTRLKNEDAALLAYEKALSVKPDYPAAAINLGVRYARKQQYQKAISLYRSVLKKDETYTIAWANLGTAYLETRELGPAKEAFRKAVTLAPEKLLYRKMLADTLAQSGEYDEAVAMLSEAVNMAPENLEYRIELARIHVMAGRKKEARTELEKGLALDPENPLIKKELDELNK